MTASEEDQQRPLLKRRSVLILLLALVLAGAIITALLLTSGTPRPGAEGTPSAVPTSPSGTPAPSPTGTSDPTATPATPDPEEPGEAIETPIDEPATAGGLEIEVVSVDAVEGTADEPGEIGGPAIRVTVRFENDTEKAISMRDTVVTVDAGADRTPAPELNEADGPGLKGELKAGDSAQGVYVFTLPESSRDDVRITVHTSVSAPTIVFSGAVPA